MIRLEDLQIYVTRGDKRVIAPTDKRTRVLLDFQRAANGLVDMVDMNGRSFSRHYTNTMMIKQMAMIIRHLLLICSGLVIPFDDVIAEVQRHPETTSDEQCS